MRRMLRGVKKLIRIGVWTMAGLAMLLATEVVHAQNLTVLAAASLKEALLILKWPKPLERIELHIGGDLFLSNFHCPELIYVECLYNFFAACEFDEMF